MKKNSLFYVLTCVFVLWSGFVSATEVDCDRFEKLLQEEKYTQLIEELHAIEASGEHSASMYRLLGYSYSIMDQSVEAIYHYEKAIKWGLPPNAIEKELMEAEQRAKLPWSEKPEFLVARIWKGGRDLLLSNQWAVMILFWILIGAGLYYFIPLWRNGAGLSQKFWIAYSFLGLLVASLAISRYQYEKSEDEAIVMELIQLYAAPETESELVRFVPPGTKVEILDSFDGWSLVLLPNLQEGWMQPSAYRVL